MKTLTKNDQASLTPKKALEILKEGNKRFCDGNMSKRDLMAQASETASGQFPLGIVLSCVDSRTSVELIFDQGIGDVFSARVAGNVVNEDVLGSMEFACAAAGSKIIVVLGHSACGAVKGACDNVELGNLTSLLSKIKPAIESEKSETQRNSSNAQFVEKVTHLNVRHAVNEIMEKSAVLKGMVEKGEIGIIGANHNIATGKVEFFEDTYLPN